ncbi:VOC family protein [Mucilaginibacter jinjuensis]|uniref:VOC family protein n=1 Tax=Mucilaginibacter jinjuensis TaxID=1176721 RepID=A0ABY7T6R8_9SPHI|nr:VOC family protein [Mucilaginibacter jinjuensis]WCT11908.1 VOC family protein [Mucilaginibacter jinjuensis]
MSDFAFVSPFLIVANLRESVSFYIDKLKFKILYIGPEEEPYFAMIGRGPISLMLKSSGEPLPNHTRYNWARWDAFISVSDPDALYEEYRAAGVVFSQTLQDDTDGLRGFELSDTDGYILFFGRPKS